MKARRKLEPPVTNAITTFLRSMYSQQRDVTNWTRKDFLFAFGSVRQALLHSLLFAPTFVEVEGHVLLADFLLDDPDGLDEIAKKIRSSPHEPDLNAVQLVDSCNWVEIPYLFLNSDEASEEDTLLATLVINAWETRLKGLFPQRVFEVRLLS